MTMLRRALRSLEFTCPKGEQALLTAALCAVLLCAGGCATSLRRTPPPLPDLPDPEAYLQGVFASSPPLTHLAGIVALKVAADGKTRSSRNIFLARAPDCLRLEILGLFNRPAAFLMTDGTRLSFYVLDSNTLFTGPPSAESVAALTGIAVSPHELLRLLLDQPIDSWTRCRLRQWDVDEGRYYFELDAGSSTYCLWVNPDDRTIGRIVHLRGNEQVYTLTRSKFVDLAGRPYPSRLCVEHTAARISLEASLENLRTGRIPDARFRFTPPPGAVVRPIQESATANP